MDGRTEQPGERGRTPAPLAAEPGSAVWLQVMQFHQRTAATMQEAQAQTRRDFLAARKWPLCTWQVFAHHALMEWRQNRALHPEKLDLAVKIVKNIFELGLRKPSVQAQPRYIETFAEWLVRAPPCELCGACAPPSHPPPLLLASSLPPSSPHRPLRLHGLFTGPPRRAASDQRAARCAQKARAQLTTRGCSSRTPSPTNPRHAILRCAPPSCALKRSTEASPKLRRLKPHGEAHWLRRLRPTRCRQQRRQQ